ncbi:MAG: alkaline phosphatase [Tannerella sp.]|jgi:alkaline phosphatase|nr:alkaline phosphatase [Tannerella sp.]
MKKQFLLGIFLMMFVCLQSVCGQAKYVFYFIGDGMGINQVNITEAYLSSLKGERGSASLLMTQFPVASMAATFSADADVTDSAASGTALATGTKTNNGYIGVNPELERLESIAAKAKKAGKKVGITSTVPVNHATPAAFYGHQKNRSMYYEITRDLLVSDFDFFAGAGLYNRDNLYDNTKVPDIYPQIEQAGYTISKGYDDFKVNAGKSKKVLLVQKNWEETGDIPYAIDRTNEDLTLKQITEAAIDVLTRDNKKGFFLMLEGGRIDWAGHGNDAATVIKEVIDMDDAVKVAYEFYKKHPKETLIVITADHETGGLTAGRGGMNINVLQYQKMSQDKLTERINELYISKEGNVTWEDVKGLLTEAMGFWKNVPVSWEHEKILRDAFEETLAKKHDIKDHNLYADNSLLAAKAKLVMNDIAKLGWSTGSHSADFVPVFAVGVGQELFMRKMDNTDIPKNIMKAAKY